MTFASLCCLLCPWCELHNFLCYQWWVQEQSWEQICLQVMSSHAAVTADQLSAAKACQMGGKASAKAESRGGEGSEVSEELGVSEVKATGGHICKRVGR